MPANHQWLRRVLVEARTLLQASDTVEWLRTEAAKQLAVRADKRKTVITEMRAVMAQHGNRQGDEVDAALRFAEAEATMQQSLAGWLQRPRAPEPEGDA
jgi:hypothetical protein